jgi:hypothetical protein
MIRYQRHRKLRRARSRTPAFPVTRAVTMKAGAADPTTQLANARSRQDEAIALCGVGQGKRATWPK